MGSELHACLALALAATALGCGSWSGEHVRRFPLRDPMMVDADERPYRVACRPDPKGKPHHAVCTPIEYVSPFVWDGADAMAFRPVSRFLAVDPGSESINVNALDEVPDSSWFHNRIGDGRAPMSLDEIAIGPCDGEGDGLRPDDAADGSWRIDHGKDNGANPGFGIEIDHDKTRRYLLKADPKEQPERATGASAIATRIYHAAGYWTSCESVVYVRRSLLALEPGLDFRDNSGVARAFGASNLDRILSAASRRGDRYRFVASRWLTGKPLGPFRYEGVRKDDPNDVVAHEDRRELRGQRVLAAWLGHFDSREQNSMTTWINGNAKDPDASPGHIRHWIMDLNDCFGSEWTWDEISRRLNHTYYFDVGSIAYDFATVGIHRRPWDDPRRNPPEGSIFGYFDSARFDPEAWKPGYQNPAFSRMSERDAAWMARILSRFTPPHIERLVRTGDFTRPEHAAYLTRTLIERQHAILRRYFAILSPIADLEVNGSSLCGVDLARRAHVFSPASFRYGATIHTGDRLDRRAIANVVVGDDGRLCVPLTHTTTSASAPSYLVIEIASGAAKEPLRVHLYDLGASRGFFLAGVER